MGTENAKLEPLPYHREVVAYLKTEERALWDWFASARAREDYTENLRLALLKSTYRLDPDTQPEVHGVAQAARERLGLDIPVTLYQAQGTTEPNAALYYIAGEGHVVFAGPILSLLAPAELQGVIGHELAHYHLWQAEGGEFLVADRLLHAVAEDVRAEPSHARTARLYGLHTELFADRGALLATGDLHASVAGLVKSVTGIGQVSGASYLKQAGEIFSSSRTRPKSEQLTHPESFIRARALQLWSEGVADAEAHVAALLEGGDGLDGLDLTGQSRLTRLTRRLLAQLLRPKWFQTEAALAHAKLFFPDFKPATTPDESLELELRFDDTKLREYVCFVLLDFAAIDRDLDEMPLVAALDWSRRIECEAPFEKLAVKELKVKSRELKRLKEQAAELLSKAEGQA